MKKNLCGRLFVFVCLSLLVIGADQTWGQDTVGKTIKVGGIFDISGPTNAIGAPFAKGAATYFDYVNKRGGIKGSVVDFISIDYQYNIHMSTSAFSRLTTKENILGLLGWGSVDMPLLISKAAEIKLPVIAAAARGDAVIGKFNPSTFAIADTYSKELLTSLDWVRMDCKKRGIVRPKMALLFSEPGRESVEPVTKACEKLGFDLRVSEFFSEKSISASAQMARVKMAECQYVLTLVTLAPINIFLKEAHKIDYHPQFFGTFFAGNDALFKMAAENPGKLIVASPVAFMYQTDIPGIKKIRDFTGEPNLLSQFVAGWVGSMVLAKGIERANLKPEMSVEKAREAIRDALETFRNEDMEGLTKPMTFTKTYHIGTKGFKLYATDWNNKSFTMIPGDFQPVE